MSARLLILGGTGEARDLAARLDAAGYDVLTSLAGRTRKPADLPGRVRRGGFGGAAGLAAFLAAERPAALIDATHPFAARMPHNAERAAAAAGVPRLRLLRPAWTPEPGDDWHPAADVEAAAAMLPGLARHALVTVGAQEVAAFARLASVRVTARMIETERAPPETETFAILQARGPFRLADERALIAERGIDALVAKNAGGAATAAKLQAAREAGLPVVMIARPPGVAGAHAADPAAAVVWLDALLA